jgi:hypothetical protein
VDETTVPAENIDSAEESIVSASPVDEPTTSSSETEATTSSAEESSVETQELERKPTRAERRIRDLSTEVRQLREQSNQPFTGLGQPPVNVQAPNPGQEFDSYEQYEEKYKSDVVQAANAIAGLQVQQQTQQLEARLNLDRDVDVLPKEFPELDENSPEFNPVLVDKIESRFKREALRNGQLDPSVRLSDIAKDFVDVARAAATQSTASVNKAVATLKDETSIRPGGQVKAEKSTKDMSVKELEDRLGPPIR